MLLTHVARYRPRVVIGVQQAGVIVAAAGSPFLLEQACRLRAVTQEEMAEFRRSWAGVQALVSVNPSITPTETASDFLVASLPELTRLQPRGVHREVVVTSDYMYTPFAQDLGALIGAVPGPALQREALQKALSTRPPVFIESDDKGFGLCIVCGKKGVLGRCVRCGSLMHHACVLPETPGKEQPCPVCTRD
mgnify:CR=1 FL=1